MFAYGPELYELHSWGSMGNNGFTLDSDTQTVNLLTQKLVHLHDRVGSDKAVPSRGASPASLVAP